MSVSILHISDLHRDPKAPLANGPLLQSLLLVMNTLGVELDLIVVSGDLVHGVPPLADPTELESQYTQAEQFLGSLSDELLDGRRSRMIIVPGNHDVSFPLFYSSLKEIEVDQDKWGALIPSLFERDSNYRWSWRDRALYEINDPDAYLRRLQEFQAFYERFYNGQHAFPLDPRRQYEIFDFEDLMLTIVGYSSCHTNDPWHRLGNIHSEAIASSLAELRHPRFSGRALVGVWHHSVNAPPHRPDFMDEERVQMLLAHGFTVGLHGHQHRAERVHTTSRFGVDGQITLISAGTLCGGPSSLPAGQTRSFNLIKLDVEGGSGHLYERRMVNFELDLPLWDQRAMEDDAFRVEFTINRWKPAPPSSRLMTVLALSEAQDLIESGAYSEAVDLLFPFADHRLGRPLLRESLAKLGDADKIAKALNPPQSDGEKVMLMNALWEIGDKKTLMELLRTQEIADSLDAFVKAVRDTMIQKLKL